MELIDTHCHLTYEPLAGDIENVLARSKATGINSWIVIGTDIEHDHKSIEMAQKFDNMYAVVGIHPNNTQEVTGQSISDLKMLASNQKVVAIGETGLDFHYNFSKQPDQIRSFSTHLQIAADLNLPVVIHSREAFNETMEILGQFRQLNSSLRRVVFHCFGGTPEQARIILDSGFYISLTGVVTFKNAQNVRQVAEMVPVERMMLETDCPYMSPEPMRKQKVNDPALMIHTAEFIAGLKKMPLADFAEAVTATSKSFFGLP
jgi:TatD DNase family protein